MIRKFAKKYIKGFLGSRLFYYLIGYKKIKRATKTSTLHIIRNARIILPQVNITDELSYCMQARKVLSKPTIKEDDFYIHPINLYCHRAVPFDKTVLASMTVDFGLILDYNQEVWRSKLVNLPASDFKIAELSMIDSIEKYSDEILKILENSSITRHKKLYGFFKKMLCGSPNSLDAALQKILFFDALFWQMGHKHIGLGRLDKILYPYYKSDVDSGILDYASAKELIYQFCSSLHKDVNFKSVSIKGDTGQYILLGGIDDDGITIENEITYIFLEIFQEHPIPDPKLILRVNEYTSDYVWQKTISCILKGSGSPLIMNEDTIMHNMVQFGYKNDDVSQLGTSACWEPLIINKSFDQNNPFRSGNILKVLTEAINKSSSKDSFDVIYSLFIDLLRVEMHDNINPKKDFDCSPLFSLFYDDCISKGKDFSKGGARYAFHGAQIVGLPNTVNALLNIKEYVFRSKLITLDQLKQALAKNFVGFESVRLLLLSNPLKFGNPKDDVVDLTQRIMDDVSSIVQELSCNGQPLKVGFSSPNYITTSKNLMASADGRKAHEPLAVHISPVSSDIDIASILDFASKLNYGGNRLNGNVVDFIIPPSFAQQSDKLKAIIKSACKKGLFEIQLNVLDYETLIDAKAHPELHPDLIVRVWGFSAYFNELPEEYKDNLIERAKAYV